MRLRLLLKQAIRDFRNKLQLYISFAIFIMISTALILGLFSFVFSARSSFNEILDSTPAINQQMKWFPFVSVNGNEIDEIKNDQNANRYQVENGKLTEYTYDSILFERTFEINSKGNIYRRFNSEEMKILWKDVGYDWIPSPKAKRKNLNNYYKNNIINYIGSNSGWVRTNHLRRYQEILGLTDADLKQIFADNGEINPNLQSNENYVRYAALEKISFYVRDNERWFSNDPLDEFYDRNFGYNSNLLLKYIIEMKVKNVNDAGSPLSNAGYSFQVGITPTLYYDSWHSVAGRPGLEISESFMPSEKWMEDTFTWSIPTDEPIKNWTENWTHIPNLIKRGGLNNLVIYDRLEIDQIDPEVLASGSYGYVNPLFLKTQGYKLGDKISHFSKAYPSGYETITIIGTALSKLSLFESGMKTSLYIPFQQILKRNPSNAASLNYKDISFSKIGDDYDKGAELLKKYIYDDFQTKLVPSSEINNFPINNKDNFPYNQISISLYFYNLISTMVALITLILLFVVFYFITDQSIKLQKRTLWFLKSMGETNIRLSLITTLSSVVPVLVGIIFGVVSSFGVSQIMISISGTFLPIYFSPFGFNPFTIILLVGLIIVFFLMFLMMNFAIIRGKRMQLSQGSKIGFVTKLYIWFKPVFKYLPARVRIGNSFIAKNLFKNLLTFILLTISFTAVLFSSQFKSSSVASAHSFENRYQPYRSVILNKRSNTDSVSWNFEYLKSFFPNIQNTFESENMVPFNDLFNEISYSQGPITTYKIETNQGTIYKNVETNEEVKLTPIKSDATQTGSEKFNALIKKQINELFRISDDYFNHQPPDADYRPEPFNPEYDLKNHYFDSEYSKELLTQKTADEHSEKVFEFSDDELNVLAQKFGGLIRQIETRYNVKILEGPDELVQGFLKQFVVNWRNQSVIGFANQINSLKEATGQIKLNYSDFDFGINVYFNRDIIPENEKRTTFSFEMLSKGWSLSGIGLDERLPEMYEMISSPLKPLELNNDDFSTLYPYTNMNGEKIEVQVLDVYVSGNLADVLKLSRGEILQVTLPSFAFDKGVTPIIYVRVNRILRQASYLREIYFNKIDLFKYLKIGVENYVKEEIAKAKEKENSSQVKFSISDDKLEDKENEPSVELDQDVKDALAKRSDYKYFINAIEKLTNEDNPNAKDLFENSVFSLPNLPYGMTNFSINGTFGTGSSMLGYGYLPFLNYASQRYQRAQYQNRDQGIYIFSLITERLLNILNPIILVLDRFIILLLLITLAVSLILITLILLENKTVILLFKSLGYKKSEVNVYLTIGYIIATILALILGTVLSYFGIRYISGFLVDYLQISLFFVWSPSFILFGLLMSIIFITMTLTAVNIYTKHQKPKDAFETL